MDMRHASDQMIEPPAELYRPPAEPLDGPCGGIDFNSLPHLVVPGMPIDRPASFQVIVRQSVLNRIAEHGRAHKKIEVCGVVIGNVYRDDIGPFLYVEHRIEAAARGGQAQVTFTPQVWTTIQDEMESRYPEHLMVGWYHTHPGHGIFLSEMDLFLHGNFFDLPWQVALVYDPQNDTVGLFSWHGGEIVPGAFHIDDDQPSIIGKCRTVPGKDETVAAKVDEGAPARKSRRWRKERKVKEPATKIDGGPSADKSCGQSTVKPPRRHRAMDRLALALFGLILYSMGGYLLGQLLNDAGFTLQFHWDKMMRFHF